MYGVGAAASLGEALALEPVISFTEQIGEWLQRHIVLPMILLWICFIASGSAHAAAIEIVLSSDGDEYHQVASRIREALRDSRHHAESIATRLAQSLDTDSNNEMLKDSRLVVAVGVRALKKILDGSVEFPVYAVLVPYTSYSKLLAGLEAEGRASLKQNMSALYLDQPLRRQLALANTLGDRFRVVGILLAANSDFDIASLAVEAKQLGMALRDIRVASSREIVPALKRAKRKIDILLTMFDPSFIDTQTIKQILYFSYHRRLPVLGYSHAMVKAGALAAIFSTPEQIGQHAAEEIIDALDSDPVRLSSSSFPKYYQAICNPAVADYFNLYLDCSLESLSHPGPQPKSGSR